MAKRGNHAPVFKAKVALTALRKGEAVERKPWTQTSSFV